MRKAYVINIGDELLIGQVTNTNASYIADQLAMIGIRVVEQRVVGDNKAQILDALEDAHNLTNIVIITGGLGPTKDDMTKEALVEFFDTELEFKAEVYERIERIFSERGRKVTEAHKKQSFIPRSASLLYNKLGTAPGMRLEKDGAISYSIPGVPYEMKYLMREHILPELSSLKNHTIVQSKTLLTVGMGESDIAKEIEEIEDELPPHIKLAYLPSLGQVRLRLTAEGASRKQLDKELKYWSQKIEEVLGEAVFGYGDDDLPSVVQKLYTQQEMTVGTAESCTGGTVAHKITSVPGSSDYFKGSIIAYSNEVKERILKVSPEILKEHGAVSEPVVQAMVSGALDMLGVDVAIATSGIAGPGGGTDEKPVGTIWMAVGNKEMIKTERFFLGKDRSGNIEFTSVMALNFLRRFLMDI